MLGGGSSPPLPTLLPPPARPAKPAWKTCDCCGEEVPPSTCVICGWCRCTFHEECYDLHCPCPDTGGGGAKGGLEQRLVLALPSVFPWFKRVGANKHRNFNISFNELNQWIEHGMSVLGCEDSWSSHELRRGGTNGLLTHGYPHNDITNSGKWLSSRPLRECLCKVRLPCCMFPRAALTVDELCSFGVQVWNLYIHNMLLPLT